MPIVITRPCGSSSRSHDRARSVVAMVAVTLGLSGAMLLTACSTVGAIPGALITPRDAAVASPAAPVVVAPAPSAPITSAVPSPVAPSSAESTESAIADPAAYLATFTTRLAGNNEVPQTFSMGTGMVDALLDTRTGVLRWKLSYSNLSGPPVMAHFHGPAAIGFNAGVALPFPMPLASVYEGRATLTPQQMADLMAGKWYANLHTAKHPDGEIRGQMIERR